MSGLSTSNDRLESLADQLDAISEELAELAVSELSAAVRRGESKRPAAERRLTTARRAVEKASHLLRGADTDFGDTDG
jgi:ElaB/YqjD/DUF883 family membrane-anchored ribosome-binding protein